MNPYANTLRDIISSSLDQLLSLPATELQYKAKPQAWSKLEIIGHLIDSAYNNYQRFLRAQMQSDLRFSGYAQDEWVRRAQYHKREPQEVIQGWQVANLHLAQLLDSISQNEMQLFKPHNFHQIGMNPISEEVPANLAYLIWDYIYHLEHHLGQLLPSYAKRNLPHPLKKT